MPSRSAHIVLMYHAILVPGADLSGADARYAVSQEQFLRHLEIAQARGERPASVQNLLQDRDASTVAFTFDDGHESNAWAAQTLADAGAAGDFFVNSSTIGTPGYLSWAALRDMHAAGMSIQSHGHQHRYLDVLDAANVRDELCRSKAIIEDRLGVPVTVFAPPGGRRSHDLQQIAKAMGYEAICTSRIGPWKREGSDFDIPRMAVLRSTPASQMSAWVHQDQGEFLRQLLRYGVLRTGKRLLGNENYERLRGGLLKLARGR